MEMFPSITCRCPSVATTKAKIPAPGIKKFREVSRDRFFSGEELGRFFEALDFTESRYLFRLRFPEPGKTGHYAETKHAWETLLKRTKLEDFRIHDLRRRMGSWMAIGGISLPIVG